MTKLQYAMARRAAALAINTEACKRFWDGDRPGKSDIRTDLKRAQASLKNAVLTAQAIRGERQ